MPQGMEMRGEATSSTKTADAFTGKRIHMIGIGGSGMRALAGVLLKRGAVVSGSDAAADTVPQWLTDAAAAVHGSQRPENSPYDCDAVVYTAAVGGDNPELAEAKLRGVEVLK